MSYEDACKAATTQQGLDPMTRHLREAGIPAVVEQTGGFCMVLTVYLNEGHTEWIGITREEFCEGDEQEPGEHAVMFYSAHTEYEGIPLDWCAAPDRVVSLIRAHTNPVETRNSVLSRLPERLNSGPVQTDDSHRHVLGQVWDELFTVYDPAGWLRDVNLWRCTHEQIDDLILLVCTYARKSIC